VPLDFAREKPRQFGDSPRRVELLVDRYFWIRAAELPPEMGPNERWNKSFALCDFENNLVLLLPIVRECLGALPALFASGFVPR